MLPDGMGVPHIEVRFLIEGDEVAVAAFFITESGAVDVIVGVDDAEYAPHIARTLETAGAAIRTANWKEVSLGGLDGVPFEVDGQGSCPDVSSSDEQIPGDVSSETDFPF